jgi:hypothetical protein
LSTVWKIVPTNLPNVTTVLSKLTAPEPISNKNRARYSGTIRIVLMNFIGVPLLSFSCGRTDRGLVF